MDFVVKATGEFGEFVGPRFFNTRSDAEAYAAELNGAILPHVPRFELFELRRL
jgi:hypothetical protein